MRISDWSSDVCSSDLVWRHWLRFLAGHYRYVRYDERGCGLSDWEVGELALESWIGDLESVVDAAGLRQPFILLGISQGARAAVAHAARPHERVPHLALYGAYALGTKRRGDADVAPLFRLLSYMPRFGRANTNPSYRPPFTPPLHPY